MNGLSSHNPRGAVIFTSVGSPAADALINDDPICGAIEVDSIFYERSTIETSSNNDNNNNNNMSKRRNNRRSSSNSEDYPWSEGIVIERCIVIKGPSFNTPSKSVISSLVSGADSLEIRVLNLGNKGGISNALKKSLVSIAAVSGNKPLSISFSEVDAKRIKEAIVAISRFSEPDGVPVNLARIQIDSTILGRRASSRIVKDLRDLGDAFSKTYDYGRLVALSLDAIRTGALDVFARLAPTTVIGQRVAKYKGDEQKKR